MSVDRPEPDCAVEDRPETSRSDGDRPRAGRRTPCPARPGTGDRCPFGGISTCEHDHDPVFLAAAIKRNEAIDKAAATFKAARDPLLKLLSGEAFRAAIRTHERAFDDAKDAAWSAYDKETAK